MALGFKNIPKGAFIRDCRVTMKRAVPMLTGILSKMLRDRKTTVPSKNVRTEMPMIPNKGVHLKKLPDMNEEK